MWNGRRAKTNKLVLADGCFDPPHVGHLAYLKAAATFGSVLVRVAPDDAVFDKGRVPFQELAERMVFVLGLKPVEAVCTCPTLAEAVLEYKPTHLVKGMDWKDRLPPAVEAACLLTGTEMVFVDTQSKSSSERLSS